MNFFYVGDLSIAEEILLAVKLSCLQLIMHQEPDVFTMEDGLHNTVTLRSAHREVIAAVFHKFVQRNAGECENT